MKIGASLLFSQNIVIYLSKTEWSWMSVATSGQWQFGVPWRELLKSTPTSLSAPTGMF